MRCDFKMLSFETLPKNRQMLVLRSLLEALVVVNWNFILTAPGGLPSLRQFIEEGRVKREGVPVRPARASSDSWLDIPSILSLGSGGPKDYACWLIAELRNDGEDDVYPHIKVTQRVEGSIWEIKVRHGERVIDPCAGMAEATAASS
jgi:hypothetical protein